MKNSLIDKLDALCERYEALATLLADAEVAADPERFRELARERAGLETLAKRFGRYRRVEADIETARALLGDDDADLRALAEEELSAGQRERESLERELRKLLLPKDPSDTSNVFLEIRAGTGGDEAALFSGDLFRMYCRYAEARRWRVEIVGERPGERGGYKEIISRLAGREVYAHLKFESGAHRVQRVPETESQGRIHTSACTVAVLPEAAAIDEVEIDKADLRVDTYRASGAGGQHVNKSESAVRVTHLPSGIVAECQDERSQHQNRARAMALLQAKLLAGARDRQAAERAAQRRNLVGSGDRSDRIRTYNFPQGRVTDHRIGLTLYKLESVLAGGLGALIEPLRQEHQADLLAALADEAR